MAFVSARAFGRSRGFRGFRDFQHESVGIVKRVLVTGGAGFIGSHLVEALLARGDHVTVVDDESTGNAANLASVRDNPRLNFVRGSIGEDELVREVVAGQDEVYHLAAQSDVRLSFDQPLVTAETTGMGTLRMLEATRQYRDRSRQDARFY